MSQLNTRINSNNKLSSTLGSNDIPPRVNAIDFLTPDRFDIIAKYLYVKFKDNAINSDFAKSLYLDHIKLINGFVENDGSNKIGKDGFLKSFDDLITSIKIDGFEDSSIIPLSSGHSIIDGAHRVSCSIYFDQKVPAIITRKKSFNFDYNFFKERGLSLVYLDAMAHEYARLKENVFIVTIWPRAKGCDDEISNILSQYGKIVYEKNILFNSHGLLHLVKQAYRKEYWVGSYSNDFEGARNKSRWCYLDSEMTRVILFESKDNLIIMKNKIRELFKIDKHTIHINDTKEETLELAELLFNKNSIEWMNNSNVIEYKIFNSLFSKYKNWFIDKKVSSDDFALIGGTLAVYGTRESSDIDYICKPLENYDFGNKNIELETKKVSFSPVEMDDLIYNPNYYFYAYGKKFVSLGIIKSIKESRKQGRDLEDATAINNLIEHGRVTQSFLAKLNLFSKLYFWKRNIKFFLLKLRLIIFSILKIISKK